MATALWAPSPTSTLAALPCHSSRLAGRLSSSVCASYYVCCVGSRTPQSATNLTPLPVRRRGSRWVCQARRKASRRVEAEDESELEDDDLRNGLNEVRSTSFSRLHLVQPFWFGGNCPILATQDFGTGMWQCWMSLTKISLWIFGEKMAVKRWVGGWVDGVESCQVNPMQLVVHFFITLGCEIGHLCYVLWVLCCDTLFGGFRVSPICLLNNWNMTSSQCN